jgi:hypothetical protein
MGLIGSGIGQYAGSKMTVPPPGGQMPGMDSYSSSTFGRIGGR